MRFGEQEQTPRICEACRRKLPRSWKSTLCPKCTDDQMYRQVKEYILTHNVTETEVAEHFHIPLHQVREWIRDGRIDYRKRW